MSGDKIAGLPFGWGAIIALANLILGGGAFAAWIKNRPKMKEINVTAEERLRDDLIKRVEKLEADLVEARKFYEAKIDKIQAQYETAQSLARHELANAKMRFRALVMLLKRLPNPPAGLAEILADIEAMEIEQTRTEALEKGAAAGAKVATATLQPS